jgi:lysophospholipase L1-like esterase
MFFNPSARLKKTLIFIYFIFISLLLFIPYLYREEIIQKQIHWNKSAKIVMLGDSHIAKGKWNFTLHSKPVLKYGWSGFTTEMLLSKIPTLRYYNSTHVFILCGGNDIYAKSFSVENTVNNLKLIAENLKKKNLIPVFQKLIYQHNNSEFNIKIDAINEKLTKYCLKEKFTIIDIGKNMYDAAGLKASLTTDNLHLNNKAYSIWSAVVNNYLKHN